MFKHSSTPRQDWKNIVEGQGLLWHSSSDLPYWNEDSYYAFSKEQALELETAGNACYQMFLTAGDYIIQHNMLDKFGIPEHFHQYIIQMWDREPPALNYGRFDFAYNGYGKPKLLEFNCDTPTSLLEASVVQWHWKEALFPEMDQFNGIHEALVAKWKDIKPELAADHVWFTHADDGSGEDAVNVSYMRDIAEEAGIITHGIFIEDIGWDGSMFVDTDNYEMSTIQHLYPWEWLANEEISKYIAENWDITTWIEPVWKMMWSNKAILPILYSLFPTNPYLLPTYFHDPRIRSGVTGQVVTNNSWVKKPILAREGANISIYEGTKLLHGTDGDYGEEGYVWQERYFLPEFEGKYPVLGVWNVDGISVGMGIREDGLITGNTAKFVPHIIS